MKTGFVNAYVNIPGRKSFKYHGMNDNCVDQIDPYTRRNYDTDPVSLAHWVLFADIEPWGYFLPHWDGYPFLPSTDPDPCTEKFPDGFARYIKYEFLIVKFNPDDYYFYLAMDGWTCGQIIKDGYDVPLVYKYNGRIWRGDGTLCMLYNCAPGSYLRIWGSDTGEWPG